MQYRYNQNYDQVWYDLYIYTYIFELLTYTQNIDMVKTMLMMQAFSLTIF